MHSLRNKYQILILIELILSCSVFYLFSIEANLGFPKLLAITLIGYIIFSLNKFRHHQYLLLGLCLLSILVILDLTNSAILLFAGVMFYILIEYALKSRAGKFILVVVTIILAITRLRYDGAAIDSRLWVILSSIFMFRTILYLYHRKVALNGSRQLNSFNYFFLFPNIFSPLFPIIDTKDFLKDLSSESINLVQLRGINLISLGLIQIIIYRLIYTYLTPSLSDISNTSSLLAYIVFNYLLVFRLMGILNICVGTIRLFGYDLPEIFNNIFISAGVSDFFRRLNIYWKEFLLTVIYYPIFFKLRKHGILRALILSSIVTFLFNWLLHAYQWFWILGTSQFRYTDTLFWFLFSLVAIIEMIYQAKYQTKPSKSLWTTAILWPLKVMTTFMFIAIIWSIWTAPSLELWFNLTTASLSSNDLSTPTIIVLGVVLYISLFIYKRWINIHIERLFTVNHLRLFLINTLILVPLVIISILEQVQDDNQRIKGFCNAIRQSKINKDDRYKQEESYYDGILEFNIGSANWDLGVTQPKEEQTGGSIKDVKITLEDLRISHFLPNTDFYTKNNVHFQTNNIGLRGPSYPIIKDENVKRIAFLGGSPESGLNLSNHEIFINITEQALREDLNSDDLELQVFNYSLAGYTIANYRTVLDLDIIKISPDYVILTVRTREYHNAYKRLSKSITDDNKVLDKSFSDFLMKNKIELNPSIPKSQIQLHGEQLWQWNMNEIMAICAERNIKPIILFIPQLSIYPEEESNYAQLMQYAHQMNIKFIDLKEVFSNEEINTLTSSGKDIGNHPNAKGHRLIAEMLTTKLTDFLVMEGL